MKVTFFSGVAMVALAADKANAASPAEMAVTDAEDTIELGQLQVISKDETGLTQV